MSEDDHEAPYAESDPVEPASAAVGFEPTGHPGVDRVLEDLQGLDEAPLEEHVGRFEAAQSALRGVLDGPGREGPPVPGPR